MRPISLHGARTHNLRNIDLTLEPGTLVAIAGPSGAGKSSLAFATLYAEGQRRYVESFSAYARQFLERLERPPVTSLEPVPAAVAVDRQAPVRTSRSTVATMTEISDYAKSLWARAAVLHCPSCGRAVQPDAPEQAAAAVLAAATEGARAVITFPMRVASETALASVAEALVAQGYRRVLVRGEVREVEHFLGQLASGTAHTELLASADPDREAMLDVVADRVIVRPDQRGRLIEAIEAAMHRGGGRADVHVAQGNVITGEVQRFSRRLHCAHCDREFRPATPGLFSFNSPIGACETCRGFGRVIGIDMNKVLPDPRLSLAQGAIRPWRSPKCDWERQTLRDQCKRARVPMDVPVESLSEAQRTWLIEGDDKGWWGVRGWFSWLEGQTYKMHMRIFLARYRSYDPCPACHGTRLKPEALDWRLSGKTVAEFLALSVAEAHRFIAGLGQATGTADPATSLLIAECAGRLDALSNVGLDYLTLDRASRTLSGGEAQRVGLTSALGASLAGAMIVLDEPTVGLHPGDVGRLFGVIQKLASADNVVLVVEHDPVVIRGADRVVELGPGAGEHGGQIVFDGPPAALASADTATARALRAAPVTRTPRSRPSAFLRLRNARGNNLTGIDVDIPRGALTCITGVSGSGKSSLVLETLAPAAARAIDQPLVVDTSTEPLPHDELLGAEDLAGVIVVDQTPLGRTARGNPATYVKAWDWFRKRLASQPLARERGYTAGTFSFNVPGGRCEDCKGEGAETVEMQFLADVSFSCPACGGKRFTDAVLDVRYEGKNAAEILDMTIDEALAFFGGKALKPLLAPVANVGLGYLRLGQPLSTLSGGEAQRLKLAEALSQAEPGSLVLIDEPTAGLHPTDITPLLAVLDALASRGDTVVVVEHDMHVAAHADWIIDLGPGPGAAGGTVVAAGTPEEVARATGSVTAPFLAAQLGLTVREQPWRDTASRAAEGPGPHRNTISAQSTPGSRAAQETHAQGHIEITGAREHNLKNVSVTLPREQLVVVTGPSGSGKSTLAFDVLYAEGQRRYLETLSPYARQYLPQLPRPVVDRVLGVPPSVALEQRLTGGGANSTVATITEVAHYLRVLYARAGRLHCPQCQVSIEPRPPAALAHDLRAAGPITVLAPVVRGRKGQHRDVFTRARARGFTQARIDGELVDISDAGPGVTLDRYKEHDIELVVADQLDTHGRDRELVHALEQAAELGSGTIQILHPGQRSQLLSTKRACPSCGTGFPELDPRMFSFNTRQGACETCEGRGVVVHTHGRGRRAREVTERCPACEGTRLSALARAVTVADLPITALLHRSVHEARDQLAHMRLAGREAEIGAVPLAEAASRIAFLDDVGVGYLELDRAARTLSGGEMQRVRLAAQLGSGLTGVLYVLDEPTIGLHPRDTNALLASMRSLVDRGNSLVVVEHDADVIRAADHVIDIGPGGGRHGGQVVAQGSVSELRASQSSITGPALDRPAPIPSARRPVSVRPHLALSGASLHNLRNVDVQVPLGCLVVVTGVSGSGKTTLVRQVLHHAVREALGLATESDADDAVDISAQSKPSYRSLAGTENLRRAVEIDQSPIGRTPRSVPATYIGIWDHIRKLLAATPEARARGYALSRFSFNVAEGRCAVCEGQGALTAEMAFLPDVLLPCDACGGMRFNAETLEVTWRGRSAGELLDLDVTEAIDVFAAVSKVVQPLRLLADLGLGYLKLGQASNTLSGGEAQRLKLVSELGTRSAGGTLYIMDEPTTGLHRDDVARLIGVLHRLVDRGDTVLVIEHHLDVMLAADWIIDMGPEGGVGGGQVVAVGTPETVAAAEHSQTGAALAREMARSRA